MKIIDLINAKNAFDLNCKYDGDMQLALKVIKFIKAIETETNFYNKKYSEIVSKYAIKDENGAFIQNEHGLSISKDSISAFTKEVDDLNAVEVEVPNIKFNIDELNKCDLTGNGLYALYPFIDNLG